MRDSHGAERARPATLKDVASLAGVSIATVSKALNGREHVRAETRARVQAAAEKLSFQPNVLAKGLLAGRTGTVGLLASDLDGRFSIPVMMGAEDAFGAGSTSVFLCDARGDSIREQHHLRALLSRRIDGLIVVGDTTNPRETLGRDMPVPVVYAYAPSTDPEDISVVSDNVGAGRIAADHMLDCGRSRIAYISGDVSYHAARDRVEGATAALAARGLNLVGGEALYGAWTEGWGRGAVRTLLSRNPDLDGILCGSDQIARGALDALREAGRDVPGDIAVMGHDNWEQIAAQSRPPLSTIDMRLEEVGRLAAELLFTAIDGDYRVGTHSVATRLVTRGSTALAG
ncbi:LacI family transcriptional regulator [Agromyces atrinae]|uniref:LacI family transcriptional regulator n=1 Tax=Agromyces atrinae TaxID=592376 RepID=A0A4Q2M1J1_9MICO|nr:LacI family DNA-binding transcriptional regulator [Agromyces atrinae]MCI2956232.1 LacI family transcriptional regulator [Agromyces atrinae]NYD68368.1 LacI family transcriptional regulator [Agromyces atrinae]RXZ85588.1 LacI family transcriptional regulator [Agromyces atrinae]